MASDVTPRGYADTAERFLTEAAEGQSRDVLGPLNLAGRQLRATIGAGYAMLAVAERLATVADHLADANDAATEAQHQLGEIAGAVIDLYREPLGSRVLGAFGRLACRARPGRARKPGAEPLRSITGPGKSAFTVRYLEKWSAEHPGGLVVAVHDPKDLSGGAR